MGLTSSVREIEISVQSELWPSGRGTGIGVVGNSISSVAKELMAPILREVDVACVLCWVPQTGLVSFCSEDGDPNTGVLIVVDEGSDILSAAKELDNFLGAKLSFRWADGIRDSV
ncbi:hypothetical protein [Shimia sp. MIT1388]|uniref:hypothetical protein n=1 Tax=Shimia sp. MIT1388 TaxID=3096992 RepID=UPI00399998A9